MGARLSEPRAIAMAAEMFLAKRRREPNPHPEYGTADALLSQFCPRYGTTKKWDRKKREWVTVPPLQKHVVRYHRLCDAVYATVDVMEGFTERRLRKTRWGVRPYIKRNGVS